MRFHKFLKSDYPLVFIVLSLTYIFINNNRQTAREPRYVYSPILGKSDVDREETPKGTVVAPTRVRQSTPPQTKPKQAKPEQTQPKQAKPEQIQPKQAKPEQTQPKPAKPEQTQPNQAKPEQTQPKPAKPEQTQPKQVRPEQTQPKQAKPEQIQPKQVRPEQTQPKPAKPEQIQPKQVRPEQTQPKQAKPEQIQPKQVRPEQTQPKPAKPEQIQPKQVRPEQTQPKQAKPEQTQPKPAKPEQTQPKPAKPEQIQPKQVRPEQTQPKQVRPEQTQPKQAKPEQTQPKQAKPEQIQPKQAKPEQTQPKQARPNADSLAVIAINGFPAGIKLLINRPKLCTRHKDLKYIMYFNTAPDHFSKRMVMRNTWVSENVFPKRIMGRAFFIGRTLNATLQKEIDAESEEFQDIIQGDFIDSYWNLTVKGLVALKWVDTYCKQAEFALKGDDDVFVNILGVVHVLENYKHKKHSIFGYCKEYGSARPARNETGKWHVSKEEFADNIYPTYCLGVLYAMSRDLVPELYRLSYTTPLFKVDDVYLSGILAAKVDGIEHINFQRNFSIKCQPIMDDMKKKNETFTHTIALCPKWMLKNMWGRYKERAYNNITLVEQGVYNSTFTIERQAVLKQKLATKRKAKQNGVKS